MKKKPSAAADVVARIKVAAIENVPIGTVARDLQNKRSHDRRNMEAIKSSLARFGQIKPIIVDKAGVVRAGNGTLAAAKELGWTEIAVSRPDLSDAEFNLFAIADNRTSDLSEFDDELLAQALGGLSADDRLAAGFTADDLDELTRALEKESESAAASPGGIATGSADKFEVIIECDSEAQQKMLFDELGARGLSLRLIAM